MANATRNFELAPLRRPSRERQQGTPAPDGHAQDHASGNDGRQPEAPAIKLHSLADKGNCKPIRFDPAPQAPDMHIVFIDLEDVQPNDIGALAGQDTRVYLFLGQTQTRLPLGLVQALQPLGSAVTFVHGKAGGRNSMDAIISFYLGRLSVEMPDASFTIMSRDAGFDPLLICMKEAGVQCRRVADTSAMEPTTRRRSPNALEADAAVE